MFEKKNIDKKAKILSKKQKRFENKPAPTEEICIGMINYEISSEINICNGKRSQLR